ncbi:hypothetical protein [Thermomonospora amylolytica]|nr:hypothetical protein [Thermomonospora amylolytica]
MSTVEDRPAFVGARPGAPAGRGAARHPITGRPMTPEAGGS